LFLLSPFRLPSGVIIKATLKGGFFQSKKNKIYLVFVINLNALMD